MTVEQFISKKKEEDSKPNTISLKSETKSKVENTVNFSKEIQTEIDNAVDNNLADINTSAIEIIQLYGKDPKLALNKFLGIN